MRWNVVRDGRVVGTVDSDGYAEAQRLAVEQHGLGARASAPADPNVPAAPRRPMVRRRGQRPSVVARATVGAWQDPRTSE